jgi:acyl dehydratase
VKYWEDFTVDEEIVHGTHEITADEIVRFAREFDPQPFHTDPDVDGPFGGLIASDWHSAALYMGMFVRNVLLDTASLGSPVSTRTATS